MNNLHPSNWALRYAPAPSAEARLVLISISDKPAGDTNHCINLEQISRDAHISVAEVNEHIKWFTGRGIIVIRPDEQRPRQGETHEYICYLNTAIIMEES